MKGEKGANGVRKRRKIKENQRNEIHRKGERGCKKEMREEKRKRGVVPW